MRTRLISPTVRLPPIAIAAETTTPSDRLHTGSQRPRNGECLVYLDSGMTICMKYLLNRFAEVARQGERQGKRRGVALRLDRVDRLARDVHLLGEPLLRELLLTTQSSNFVLHRDVKLA